MSNNEFADAGVRDVAPIQDAGVADAAPADAAASDAGRYDAAQTDAGPIQDAGFYVKAPAGHEAPIWFSKAEADAGNRVWSALINLVPVVGTLKGVYEAISDEDLFTGEELPGWDRVLNAVAGFGAAVGVVAKGAGLAADGRKVVNASDDLVDALNALPHLKEVGHAGYIAAGSAAHLQRDGPALLGRVIELLDSAADGKQMLEALFGFAETSGGVTDAATDLPDVPADGRDAFDPEPVEPSPGADQETATPQQATNEGMPEEAEEGVCAPDGDKPDADTMASAAETATPVDTQGDGIPDMTLSAESLPGDEHGLSLPGDEHGLSLPGDDGAAPPDGTGESAEGADEPGLGGAL